jgi:hypothetical protein
LSTGITAVHHYIRFSFHSFPALFWFFSEASFPSVGRTVIFTTIIFQYFFLDRITVQPLLWFAKPEVWVFNKRNQVITKAFAGPS